MINFDDLQWEEPNAMKFYSEMKDGEIVAVWSVHNNTTFRANNGWHTAERITGKTSEIYQLFNDGQLDYRGKNESNCNDLAIWNARERFVKIEMTEKQGRGYSGGHNTAVRKGWSTYTPKPEAGSVMWLDITSQGRFTGYYPATRMYKLAVAQ